MEDFKINAKECYFVCNEFLVVDKVSGKDLIENEDNYLNCKGGYIEPIDIRGTEMTCDLPYGYTVRLILNKDGNLLAEIYDGKKLLKSGFTGITFIDDTCCVELHKGTLYLYSSRDTEEDFFATVLTGKISSNDGCFVNVLYGEDPISPKKYSVDSELDMECFDFSSESFVKRLRRKIVADGLDLCQPYLKAREMVFSVSTGITYNCAFLDSNYMMRYIYDEDFGLDDEKYSSGEYDSNTFYSRNRGYKVLGNNTIVASFLSKYAEACMIYVLYHNGYVFVSTNAFSWYKYVDKQNKVSLIAVELDDDICYEGAIELERRNSALSDYYLSGVSLSDFLDILQYLPVVFFNSSFYRSMLRYNLLENLSYFGLSLKGELHEGAVKFIHQLSFPLLKGQERYGDYAYFTNGCLSREVYGDNLEVVLECLEYCLR